MRSHIFKNLKCSPEPSLNEAPEADRRPQSSLVNLSTPLKKATFYCFSPFPIKEATDLAILW